MSNLMHRKNLEECCRTCLNDLSTKMHCLFDEKNDSPNVAEILCLFTNIMVSLRFTCSLSESYGRIQSQIVPT